MYAALKFAFFFFNLTVDFGHLSASDLNLPQPLGDSIMIQ